MAKGVLLTFTLAFSLLVLPLAEATFPNGKWTYDDAENWLRSPDRTKKEVQTGVMKLADRYFADDRWQEAIWILRFGGKVAEADALEKRLAYFLATAEIQNRIVQGNYSQKIKFSMHQIFGFEKTIHIANEVLAYRLDRLLGLDIVPLTIFRGRVVESAFPESKIRPIPASLQYYVRETRFTPRYGSNFRKDGYPVEQRKMWLLDFLLDNRDRHAANWLVRFGDLPVAIDHGTSMGNPGMGKAGVQLENLPEGEILERLKNLKPGDFSDLSINTTELFKRRDEILRITEIIKDPAARKALQCSSDLAGRVRP